MTEESKGLRMLLEEAERSGGSVSKDLIRDIYTIEERVQFDRDRREAPLRVQRLVKTAVEQEDLDVAEGDTNAPE